MDGNSCASPNITAISFNGVIVVRLGSLYYVCCYGGLRGHGVYVGSIGSIEAAERCKEEGSIGEHQPV